MNCCYFSQYFSTPTESGSPASTTHQPTPRTPNTTNRKARAALVRIGGGLVVHGAGLLSLGLRWSTSRRVVFLVRVAHGVDHRRGALWVVGALGGRGGCSGLAVASGALSMGQSFGSCTGGRSERPRWTKRTRAGILRTQAPAGVQVRELSVAAVSFELGRNHFIFRRSPAYVTYLIIRKLGFWAG